MARTVHIIGAGLAGLAAAVRLEPSAKVVVHEATAYPGGRCRSFYDRTIGMTIDNGNHLVLSGNKSVLSYAEAIGSSGGLVGPAAADFPFVDLASNERWTLRINDGLQSVPVGVAPARDGRPWNCQKILQNREHRMAGAHMLIEGELAVRFEYSADLRQRSDLVGD